MLVIHVRYLPGGTLHRTAGHPVQAVSHRLTTDRVRSAAARQCHRNIGGGPCAAARGRCPSLPRRRPAIDNGGAGSREHHLTQRYAAGALIDSRACRPSRWGTSMAAKPDHDGVAIARGLALRDAVQCVRVRPLRPVERVAAHVPPPDAPATSSGPVPLHQPAGPTVYNLTPVPLAPESTYVPPPSKRRHCAGLTRAVRTAPAAGDRCPRPGVRAALTTATSAQRSSRRRGGACVGAAVSPCRVWWCRSPGRTPRARGQGFPERICWMISKATVSASRQGSVEACVVAPW